jgi:signal transduction histidine kinase
MEEDKSGNIWIGARLDGLHRYDPKRKTFKSFKNVPGDSTSMPTNEIVELSYNFQGKLWIGTGNKGPILFDPATFTFQKNVAGINDKNITNIIEDDAHHVWFTSVGGVHKFDPATLKIYNYSIADGLQGTQFNEGTRLKSADGTYYLGGTNGLNVFRPENIIDDTAAARVVFTKFSLFNKPVNANDKSGLLTRSISKTESITLQADDNVFSLEFACLEFNFPKKNRYRYYLEGFDKEWNDANASRTATYTDLPPGEYTLKISASNRRGQWNENAAKIRIIIIPRWYERFETKLAAAIFLIVLTVLIIHVRTKLLFKQKLKLEQLVKARTNLVETQKLEIKDKNTKLEQAYEEVNSTNEELQRVNSNLEKLVENRTAELTHTIKKLTETDKGLDTFLYRSSHDLRGPIATILGLAHLGKMEQDPNELMLYFANIERTSTRMLRLLRKLDETSSLFRAQRTLEVIDANDLIQNVNASIEELNANGVVKIEFENNVGPVFTGDAALLKCIITSLMENSIVFRSESHAYAKCVLSIESEQLVINVIDNGTGIPSSAVDRITNMFYRGSEKSIGNGLGLFMVKKALEVLHGRMEIDSEPNVMTTFTIKIPYERK